MLQRGIPSPQDAANGTLVLISYNQNGPGNRWPKMLRSALYSLPSPRDEKWIHHPVITAFCLDGPLPLRCPVRITAR